MREVGHVSILKTVGVKLEGKAHCGSVSLSEGIRSKFRELKEDICMCRNSTLSRDDIINNFIN